MDFWHASAYLVELGLALYPDDEARRNQTIDEWRHRLKHEGGLSMIRRFSAFDLTSHSSAARQAHADWCDILLHSRCH